MSENYHFSVPETVHTLRLGAETFSCLAGFVSSWDQGRDPSLLQQGVLTVVNPDERSPVAAVSLMTTAHYHSVGAQRQGPFTMTFLSEEVLIAVPRDEKGLQEDLLLDLYDAYGKKNPRLSFLFKLVAAVPQAACAQAIQLYISAEKKIEANHARFIREKAGPRAGAFGAAIYERSKGEVLGLDAIDPFFASPLLSANKAVQSVFARLFASLKRPRGSAPLQKKHFGF